MLNIIKKTFLVLTITTTTFCFFGCNGQVGSEYPSGAPLNLTGQLKDGIIEIRWEKSLRRTETGYEIWKAINDKQDFQCYATVGNSELVFLDGDINFEKTYYYKIKSLFPDGTGFFSESVKISTGPSEPRNLTAAFTGISAQLIWEPSDSSFESGYEVWRSDEDDANYLLIAALGVGELEYTDSSVIEDATYYYKVKNVYGDKPGEFTDPLPVYTGYVWSFNFYGDYDGDGDYEDPAYRLEEIDPNSGTPATSFDAWNTMPACSSLTYDGDYFWTGQNLYSDASIFKISPDTGLIIDSLPSPSGRIKSITYDGSEIWVVAYNFGETRYDIFEIDPNDGNVKKNFPKPGSGSGDLAFDGQYLWLASGDERKLYQINPTTGTVVKSFNVPYARPWGIAWDGVYFWVSQMDSSKVVRVNPTTGQTMSFLYNNVSWIWGLSL